jgi:hypothetical protein
MNQWFHRRCGLGGSLNFNSSVQYRRRQDKNLQTLGERQYQCVIQEEKKSKQVSNCIPFPTSVARRVVVLGDVQYQYIWDIKTPCV